MSETEPIASVDAAPGVGVAAKAASSIDVANRPKTSWLNQVEAEIDDVDLVLKCLARDSASICQTCSAAKAEGVLDQRPVLARCARTKQAQAV